MGKKKFAAIALDLKHETYVVHVRSISSNALPSSFPLDIYPSRRPQISGLIVEKTLTKVSAKYSDFVDVFSSDLVFKLPEYSRINDHAIELVNGC